MSIPPFNFWFELATIVDDKDHLDSCITGQTTTTLVMQRIKLFNFGIKDESMSIILQNPIMHLVIQLTAYLRQTQKSQNKYVQSAQSSPVICQSWFVVQPKMVQSSMANVVYPICMLPPCPRIYSQGGQLSHMVNTILNCTVRTHESFTIFFGNGL